MIALTLALSAMAIYWAILAVGYFLLACFITLVVFGIAVNHTFFTSDEKKRSYDYEGPKSDAEIWLRVLGLFFFLGLFVWSVFALSLCTAIFSAVAFFCVLES